MNQHTIICGYGSKGRSATRTLISKDTKPEQIVVIDGDGSARARAVEDGLSAIDGDASTQEALAQAEVAQARSVIVAVDRDDTAILITLTARELNPATTIVASVREEENVHLLHQSGANGVITSSAAAGRLLGLSSDTPQVTEVFEDILTVGEGLDIRERTIGSGEEASALPHIHEIMVLGVVRDGTLIRFDDPRIGELRPGDRVIELRGGKAAAAAVSAADSAN